MEQIILNLVPGGVSPVCYVSQYDVGRKIRLHLRNGSDPYVLSGAETVTATIRKVSGEELIYDIANTSASYVDLIVNYDATDVIGESVCELIITESGLRIGSANFKMRVDPDVYSGNQKLEVVTASSPNSLLSFETNIDENLLELKAGFSPIQNGTPWIDSNEVNKEPYIKRAVTGTASRIGNHLYDKLVGGTVAFNQLIQNGNFESTTGWDKSRGNIATSNNILTYTVTEVGGDTNANRIFTDINKPANHKVFVTFDMLSQVNAFAKFRLATSNISSNEYSVNANTWTTITAILNATADNETLWLGLGQMNAQVGDTVQVRNAMLIDLTAMFSSTTIADYIYSLEQATAGAGVAWMKNHGFLTKPWFPYNAGELMSVKATAHIMRDANNTVIGNYPLDSNLELRGIPNLVNNKLEYDGDTYESSGLVSRRYGVVDLGSLNWTYSNSQAGHERFYASISGIKTVEPTSIANVICIRYTTDTINNIYAHIKDKTIGVHYVAEYEQVWIYDSAYSDAASFKASLDGVYLVYEKAETTTEQASPFTNPQVCDENGTEEYTDSRAVAIPVGHETYQANICPINGYSSANITRCGVNFLDKTSGLLQDKFIDTYQMKIRNIGRTGASIYCRIKGGQTYTVSKTLSARFLIGTTTDVPVLNTDINAYKQNNNATSLSITTTENDNYLVIFFFLDSADTKTQTEILDTIQVEVGSQPTSYHPYNGNTYAIAFGQTVYEGSLDVTRGKLTVTHGYLDLGSILWFAANADGRANSRESIAKSITSATVTPDLLCTSYPTITAKEWYQLTTEGVTVCGVGYGSNGTIGVYSSTFANYSADQVKTALSGVYICYEFATPFDIDLTPVQISALIGKNNVLGDTNGGMEIKYFRLVPRQ